MTKHNNQAKQITKGEHRYVFVVRQRTISRGAVTRSLIAVHEIADIWSIEATQDPRSINRPAIETPYPCSERLITPSWPIRPTHAATCVDVLGGKVWTRAAFTSTMGQRKRRWRETKRVNRERVNSRIASGRRGKERLRVGWVWR